MKLFKRELTLDELISGVESMMGLDDDMKKEMKAIFLKHNTTKGTRDGRRRSSNALSQVGVSPANDSHSSPSVIQGAVRWQYKKKSECTLQRLFEVCI